MVTAVGVVTVAVGRLSIWDVAPAGTVMLVERNAALEPVRVTGAPVSGAGSLRFTVTPKSAPPTTEVVETATEETVRARSFIVVVFADAPRLAVRVAVCADRIDPAVAVKLAAVAPAAIVTEAATGSSVLLLESDTDAPSVGAALRIVTVQVVTPAEFRLVGLQLRADTNTGAARLMVAVFDCPPSVAVTVAD